MTKVRLGVLATHPIQYQAPLFRKLAKDPRVDLRVYFCHDHGVRPTLDVQFGKVIQYDVPLLEGYAHEFLPNLHPQPTLDPKRLINPRIFSVLRSGDHDAFVIQGYNYLTSILALLGPHGRTKLMFRGESNLTFGRSIGKKIAKEIYLRAAFYRVAQFLSIGRLNSAYYESYGVSPDKITVAPYTVDNAFFQERSRDAQKDRSAVRKKLGLREEGTVFLFVAKLIAKKRPFDALRAFLDVADDTATLAFVGSGDLQADLENEIRARGAGDRVKLLGFRNQSELPEIYGASDVLVLPSDLETWGLVVNEAMASGMIAICSDQIGSAPDLVDPSCIYPTGDVRALGAIMNKLVSNESERARLASEARVRIEHWGIPETAEGFIQGALRAVGG